MAVHELEIAEVIQETPMDRTFVLPIPAGLAEEMRFTAGQFVIVVDPDAEKPLRRAYSISCGPDDAEAITLTVRDMGGFGHDFYGFEPGKRLQVATPQGKFTLDEEAAGDIVMVSGGSGVTPFRSFVQHLRAVGTDRAVTLFQSAQQANELIFREEFEAHAAAGDWFTYVPTVTRAADDDPWPGRRGRIDLALVRSAVTSPETVRYYACGPGAFVRSMFEIAEEIGVPKEHRRKEQWG